MKVVVTELWNQNQGPWGGGMKNEKKAGAGSQGQTCPGNWPDYGGGARWLSGPSPVGAAQGLGSGDEKMKQLDEREGKGSVWAGEYPESGWGWLQKKQLWLQPSLELEVNETWKQEFIFGISSPKSTASLLLFVQWSKTPHCLETAAPPRAKASLLSYCSTAWNRSPHPPVPITWA